MPLDIKKIIQYNLKPNQFIAEDCSALKDKVVTHHTAGGSNPFQVVDGWNSDPDLVGTAFVIAGEYVPNPYHVWKDGDILQAFSSKYYDYHLGLKTGNNVAIAKATIGAELCNWGSVALYNDKYYTYTGKEIPKEKVINYEQAFRQHPKTPFFDKIGASYKPAFSYHRYTDAQIASLKDLIIYLCDKYPKIPRTYNANMWDTNADALAGKPGVWTHVSYRKDKVDCHPQPNLIASLKTLDFHTI